MAKLRRRVAVPKGATVGRLAVIEAQTTTDADNARVKQTADPVALHPAVLLHSQLISRLGRDQRAGAILQLQRSYGNTLVAPAILAARRAARIQRQPDDGDSSGSLATAVVGLGRLVAEGEQLVLAALQGGKGISENGLTDELFWIEHPRLEGQKLPPGSPEAVRWLQIRDEVVRPLLRTGAAAGNANGAAAKPPGATPVDQIAAESGASQSGEAGAGKAGERDKYFTQDVGHYQDTNDAGKARIWLYGSSGANVCNMTSLTMSLVSMAGEPEVRAKMIDLLRSSGMHAGATVKVGGKWVPLAEALDDSKIVDQIETIDLVTAVAIGKQGGYGDVTEAGTIARIARETGLATAKVASGSVHLSDPKVRESVAQMLADGKRVIAGTVNHYVYLVEIRDDGVILHDPAGARVTPGLTAPIFLHNGNASHIAREFLAMDADRQATALRRVSTNAEVAAVVNELPRIAGMAKAERAAALQELARAHPEEITTGASNFYASGEFAANDLRLRVVLSKGGA